MINHKDVKLNIYVILKDETLSNADGFFQGFEKYSQVPVKITDIRKEVSVVERKTTTLTSFTVENSFGIQLDDIDYLYTKEEHPEYYL